MEPSPNMEVAAIRIPDGDELADKVQDWLKTQGYGLEYLAAAAFAKFGFVVRQGLTYRDPAEGKVREIDVEARCSLTADKVEMHVVAEAKYSSLPWVTRSTGLQLRKGNVDWHQSPQRLC